MKTLLLTREEVQFLRTADDSGLELLILLFIIDGYENFFNIQEPASFRFKEMYFKHNFCELNKVVLEECD